MLRVEISYARHSVLAAVVLAAMQGQQASAQNPISAKVVGSQIAAENRRESNNFGAAGEIAKSAVTSPRSRSVLDSAVSTVAQRYMRPFALSTSSQATKPVTAKQWLDSLQKIPKVKGLVEEALELERVPLGGGLIDADVSISDAAAGRALARVLAAERNGHSNPERWYVGGQIGLPLFGGENLGSVMRASARATYFVPISPFRRWQLPIVSNLGDLSSGQSESDKAKRTKLLSTSDGAYVAIEPTWDPILRSRLGDFRLQPFVSVGGQVHQMRSKADSTATISLGQGRLGAGANLEIGRQSSGQPVIFLTSRGVASLVASRAYEQVFGERRKWQMLLESYALVPMSGSTALLIESSVGRGASPLLRIGLWSQASAQKPDGDAAARPAAKGAP